ncbi:NAD(P)H-dependent oxidoreductase [Hoyosella sp. YIM 151337]|uniref:NADPH-dependent FMN reductase n=1 Tax=Hoyosella sp. YIM 151337 TaxID=2992742 RepID=UPI002236B877|nr:NAD(P)H-dependent oxidoreductase [Hoyosella sp. YIM 151337]MCW4355619.1 NAD(P)H-dependent oxidoreductase [Hoyosella sp. YIM 151337]
MNTTPTHGPTIIILIGSTREGRAGKGIADWCARVADDRARCRVDVVDLADFGFPARHPARPDAEISRLNSRFRQADGFIVVTPEYNHGYPASLKQAIDYAYEEWFAKPVAFVSYGADAHGLRAVEQLRTVFSSLHAMPLAAGLSFGVFDGTLDSSGKPRDESAALLAAKTMLSHLLWWATALRAARGATPYPA